MSRLFFSLVLVLSVFMFSCQESQQTVTAPADSEAPLLAKKGSGAIGINIALNTEVTDAILVELGGFGKVLDVINELNAVRVRAQADALADIQALAYVDAANPDAERNAPPIDTVPVSDFTFGFSTWNLDAVNVTEGPGVGTRKVAETGEGVIVGVLDTGLKDSWRQYFPEERILTQYAKSFGGGGAGGTNVSEQPNKWEHDQNSHGTHVTSTIIGYNFNGNPITGVAPMVEIVPVKVLNQNGSGWSSVIARGIVYMTELKLEHYPDTPVIINMSLGGPVLDAIEKTAIDYAILNGVIIVASAGNNYPDDMGYPGAYAPVISTAAAGWVYEWAIDPWWYALDVADPIIPDDFYIADFSSFASAGQDLDVTAPGVWIVGPYQLQSGKISYYYLAGTSMASPHVAGIVALMAEKNPSLTAAQAETILESTSMMIPGYDANRQGSGLTQADAALAATP
jgi:subtilisin family serine protease